MPRQVRHDLGENQLARIHRHDLPGEENQDRQVSTAAQVGNGNKAELSNLIQ